MGRYHWGRRSGYERLNGSSGRRRTSQIELGSSSSSRGSGKTSRRRFFWRIKVKPKLKIGYLRKLYSSPKNFLVWLRDAYVNMMLRLANSPALNSGCGAYGNGAEAFGRAPLKEYDEKVILEIYKSLVIAQSRQLVDSRDATRFGPPVAAKLAAISE